MKTLKQLREEHDGKLLSQVVTSDDEIMLEASHMSQPKLSSKTISSGPSYKQMPAMLLFRRITYRQYPGGQVVALYYSALVDKYLSIPFGPTGNLNLSEAVVLDDLDEDWSDAKYKSPSGGLTQAGVDAYNRKTGGHLKTAVTTPPSKLKKGSKAANRRKSFCARMGGMKKRLTSAKTARDPDSRINKALRKWNCEEDFNMRLHELRQQRVEEGLTDILSTAWDAAKAIGKGVSNVLNPSSGPTPAKTALGTEWKSKARVKGFSSDIKKSSSPVAQSKIEAGELAQAKSAASPQQKQVQENKMSDIRKMVKEGVEFKDLSINGRTVTLNTSMAKRILEVYDSVNTKNKKIVEGMLNEDMESFKKLLNFSIKA